MKILKYAVAAGLAVMLVLIALPVRAQVPVMWSRVDTPCWTGSDTLYGTADTVTSTRVKRICCKDWPYEQWSLAMKIGTFAGKDSADTVFARIWFLFEPGGAWTAKTNVDTFTAGTGGVYVYQEIPRPAAKPCSLRVDAWAKDANTCSTKVFPPKIAAM